MLANPRVITEEHIVEYQRDGITVLRNAFSSEWIERMQLASEEVLDKPSVAARVRRAGEREGRFQHDRMLWRNHDDFRAFVFESPAAAIAKAFLRANEVNFYFDHLLVKEPGAEIPTPWHQDLPFWPIQGSQICSIWLALDPVTSTTGGVEYVRGSHRGSVYRPEGFPTDLESQREKGTFEATPDIDQNRANYDIVIYDLEPGDCTIHHAKTLHGAAGNSSSSIRRRGLSTRWVGEDARYDPRPKADAMLMSTELKSGDRIGGSDFPRVIP